MKRLLFGSLVCTLSLTLWNASARAEDVVEEVVTVVDAFEECATTLKTCGVDAVAQAHQKMRDACSAVRDCHFKCTETKKSCKDAARTAKSDCKSECKDKKDRGCIQNCRAERRKARQACRAERRDCAKECKKALDVKECKEARVAFWTEVGKAAKQCVQVAEEGCSDVFPK